MEAISSSAWTMAAIARPVPGSTRCSAQRSMNVSQSEDEGVIGYQVQTVAPPNRHPRAEAELPSMMSLPRVLSIRSTRWGSFWGKAEAACSIPRRIAARFRSIAFAFPASCLRIDASISAGSIPIRSARTPT